MTVCAVGRKAVSANGTIISQRSNTSEFAHERKVEKIVERLIAMHDYYF
jgi:hypothetical protein